jgi:drug/metabolite transporter (DMT)-like permease
MESFRFFVRLTTDTGRVIGKRRHPVVFVVRDVKIVDPICLPCALRWAQSAGNAAAMFIPRASNPGLAALLTVLAAALLAGTTLLAKALGTDALGPALSPFQISHGRFLFALLAIAGMSALVRPRFTRPDLATHAKRSVLGWGGVTLMFAAAAFIPLSDATAISFLNPVFGMILAIPLLGERVGPVRWAAAGIALTGAAILMRPGSGVVETLAVVWVWAAPTPAQWAALAALGGLMALAQTAFINAMARGDASYVAPFFYTALIFAGLYDGLVFGVWPDAISILGAVVILGGAGLLLWREGRRRAVVT